ESQRSIAVRRYSTVSRSVVAFISVPPRVSIFEIVLNTTTRGLNACPVHGVFRCARTRPEPACGMGECRGIHGGAGEIDLSTVTAEYSAHHLQVLEGLEAVRKRPGMYIGSNGSPGLMHCLWEIIDNAVDEAVAGNGDRIDVILHADGSVEVHDKGRGIPVDVEPRTGLTGVEVVFTKLHAGGKFGGGSYAASGGLHGV